MTSLDRASAGRARAGLIQCLCGPFLAPDEAGGPAPRTAVPVLAVGFGAAVLSQVLSVSALPLAGAMLAPRPGLAAWPLAAMMIGAALATLPASLLRDGFGRRAAFALGSSLGIAGGLLAAWAVAAQQFAPLVVGALWLGIAQGFGLFYRHAGARQAGRAGTVAVAAIVAAGAVAGLAAPSLVRFAEAATAPYAFAGTLLVAAVAHVVALAGIPGAVPADEAATAAVPPGAQRRQEVVLATGLAAAAWFGMGHLMATTPVGLAGCGVSFAGVSATVAWHVVAMYVPALAAPALLSRLRPATLAAGGLGLIAAASVAQATPAADAAVLAGSLVAVGVGWCLATTASTVWLAWLAPGRAALALHDGALFLAALTGMLLG